MFERSINWKFVCDLLLLLEGVFGLNCSLLYLITIIKYRLYRKSPLLILIGNGSVAGLFYHLIIINQSLYMLIGYPNVGCIVRGHLIHSFVGSVYHSICLQGLHRLFVTVYSNETKYQSRKCLIVMLIIQWLYSLTFCLPKLNPYPMISDLCLGPFHIKYVFIHLAIFVYLIPIIFLIIIYSIIYRYIKEKTSPYILESLTNKRRLRREVSILCRIIIPFLVMLLTGLPLTLFFIQGQFTLKTPEYAVRVSILFLTAGTSITMLINIIFTDSVRQHLITKKKYSFKKIKSIQKFHLPMYKFESPSQSISTVAVRIHRTTTFDNI